jgi:UDPglucose--hexose-1-phosphate uridylyltransferase
MSLPERDPECPFCPGQEEATLEIERIPGENWQVRVVRNKYPALASEGARERSFEGIYRHVSGVGYHEVIIESPKHNVSPAGLTAEEVSWVMEAFHRRGQRMIEDQRIEHIIPFKNHGRRSGASLQHPHAQIVGLPIIPSDIRARVHEARRYYDETGDCVYCTILAEECKDGRRVLLSNDGFVSFIPFAALSPFHIWILPRRHQSSFWSSSTQDTAALSDALKRTLQVIDKRLNNPDYNYVIRSAPLRDEAREYFHWYLAIVPRVSQSAGFELGSGMYINTACPEESAAFLRSSEA